MELGTWNLELELGIWELDNLEFSNLELTYLEFCNLEQRN